MSLRISRFVYLRQGELIRERTCDAALADGKIFHGTVDRAKATPQAKSFSIPHITG